MKPRHFIFSLLALLVSTTSLADKWTDWTDANGTVWSFRITSDNTACLENEYASLAPVACVSGNIFENLSIPSTVFSGGTAYRVTSIGLNAFCDCSSLTSITIPDGVTSIDSKAFRGCKGLTSITIPDGVTSIGDQAFSGCEGLTSITIPDGVTYIGTAAFGGCKGLTSITIPDGVTSINSNVFSDCKGLTSITIPESVTSIGNDAFAFCSGLISVTIPNSVTSIGGLAFQCCSGLTDVYCYAENVPTTETNAFSLSPIASAKLHVPAASKEAYRSTEPWSKFGRIMGLDKDDSCGDNLTWAFDDATGTLSISGIGEMYDFDEDPAPWDKFKNQITQIDISNGVTSIGNRAFCDLQYVTSITIPISVTRIGAEAFSGMIGLTDFFCYAENVPTTETNAFNDSPIASAKLHVPAASKEAYRSTKPWSKFGRIKGMDEDDSCGDNLTWTFDDATGTLSISGTGEMYDFDEDPAPWDKFKNQIMQIDISNGVTSIGNRAFCDLQYVTSITIPISVTRIGAEAFSGMTALLDFFCYARDIPSTVQNTFSGLNLGSVTLHVLARLVNSYKASSIWKLFGSILGIEGETATFNGSEAKLPTVWYADRSMEPRSGLEEMHAVHYQPGNQDRSGDGSSVTDNKVFVFNLLSGFKGGAVKAGNKELTIVFNREKYANGKTQKGLSGKTYTMTATDSIVSATRNGVTKPVVKLMDTYKNKAGRWMEFQNNDYANDLHNAYPIFNSDGKTTDAFYTEMTLADLKSPIPVNITGDTDFRVRYLRPMDINHVHQGKAYFKDASEAGYDIMYIANLFDFTDWRKYPFGYNTSERFDWVNFFGIKDIYFNLDEVETDLDGSMERLEDPNLSLVQIPENREPHKFTSPNDFINSIGYIRYQNNGGAVATYNLFIPFHIVHNWGEIVKKVQVPIVGTFDDEKNIHWLDEDTKATSIELNYTSLELQGIGSKIQLVATVSPEIANQDVTWRSSDVTVVTVDADGLVTAVGIGTAQVIATTTDGSNLTASCLIDVTRSDSKLGDVNGDGDVNSADVMSIYSIMAGKSLLDRSLGDVNGDGDVNSADVMTVYSIMAGTYQY